MILCEYGPDGAPALFCDAMRLIVAREADEVVPALEAADAARAGGAWIAGWLGYEAGYALESRLAGRMPDGTGPLLVLGVFDGPRDGADFTADADGRMSAPEPAIPRSAYDAAFARVAGYIAAGDCYQVNLTFPMTAALTGSPRGLYARLRAAQPVGHGGYADLGEGPILICRSPELFFRTDGSMIEARPMKGTAPRDPDPGVDARLAADLARDEKARAENLMIVDLLRNDIGRIAEVGSVGVPDLFRVEGFATVHQMSSRVVGRLAAPASLSALMGALFPCGSITGAPKIRAMEIIRDLEPHPRGAYCGAFGWMAPDGRSAFSVAIRTLSLTGSRITLNVGGGVVHDSTADGEWEEALWKARFATLAQ